MSNILALLPAFSAKQQHASKEMKGTLSDMSESVLPKRNDDKSRTPRYGRSPTKEGQKQRRAVGQSPLLGPRPTRAVGAGKKSKTGLRRSQTLPETQACPQGTKTRRISNKNSLSATKEES